MLACNSINSTLELFTIALMAILLMVTCKRKRFDQNDRLFGVSVMLHLLATLVDLITWRLAGLEGTFVLLVTRATNLLTYLIAPFSYGAFLLVLYRTLVGELPRNKLDQGLFAGMFGVLVFSLAMALGNLKSGLYYQLDANNNFTWGPLRTLPDNLMLLQFLLLFVLVLRTTQKPKGEAIRQYWFWAGVPAAAILLENWYQTLMLIYPAVAISLLLLYVDAQRVQEEQLMRQELEAANSQTALVLSQVRPHFLYNVLNTIYYLCEKDPKTAQRAISTFSDYLRSNLDTLSQTHTVTFDVELAHVQSYLELEQLRFDDLLQVEMDIGPTAFLLPQMTVQPLVENAVKHGLGNAPQGGTLYLATRDCPDHVEIEIRDNGVGFDPTALPRDERTHVGIENVRKRLWMMSRATLTLDSSPGTGTKALIRLPKEV